MAKKSIKIIIDTNLWISFAFSSSSSLLGQILDDKNIEILGSEEFLQELGDVIHRPKFQRKIDPGTKNIFKEFIELSVCKIKVTSQVTVCRDPKDNFLLALAKDGKADYLLTGDKDLLSLEKFGETKIQRLSEFITDRYPGE